MKLFNISCLTTLIIFFASCTRYETNYYYLNLDVKNSVSFKKGSYFIYKDSTSGIIDSFWIYSSYGDFAERVISPRLTNMIENRVNQLMNQDSAFGIVETIACDTKGCNEYAILGIINSNEGATGHLMYKDNLILNQMIYNQNGYFVFQKYYDSLLLNGNIHYKIYQSLFKDKNVLDTVTNSSIYYTSFYSLTEGIIKYSIQTNTSYNSWELVKNNIIK